MIQKFQLQALYIVCSPRTILHVPHAGQLLLSLVGFSCRHHEAAASDKPSPVTACYLLA